MKLDVQKSLPIDRRVGATFSHKIERGRVSELMFTMEDGTFHRNDILSVKLRHTTGVVTVIDKISILDLATLCDLKEGRTTFGSRNTVSEPGDDDISETSINAGQPYSLNAITIPVGHLSLMDGKAELEITLSLCKAFGTIQTVDLTVIELDVKADHVYQIEYSNDLESTHNMVREVYLVRPDGSSFYTFGEGGNDKRIKAKNVAVKVEPGTGYSYEATVKHFGAITAIKGQLEQSPSSMVQVFSDYEGLPCPAVRLKVSGTDRAGVSLLLVKETLVPNLTSVSSINVLTSLATKAEAIEKVDANLAQAYRHAGVSAKSEDLKDAADSLKARTPAAN